MREFIKNLKENVSPGVTGESAASQPVAPWFSIPVP